MKFANHLYKVTVAAFAIGAVALAGCSDEGGVDEVVDSNLGIEASGGGETPQYETLKIISYNTWEGFDYHNRNKEAKNRSYPEREGNLQHYIDWVTAQNPDVVAYQELWTWDDWANSPYSLQTLATAYGHGNSFINANSTGAWSHSNSNYHVGVTSKHPFEITPKHFKEKLSHGAIHTNVKGVNIGVMHTWPNWDPPTISANGNSYNDAVTSGNAYREDEVRRVIEQTMHAYPDEPYWVFCGDFNSVSSLDKSAYTGSNYYNVHNYILESGYYDSLRERHPDTFINTQISESFARNTTASEGKLTLTTHRIDPCQRIDFIYISKALLPLVTRADVIKDEFTRNPKIASDHYPCVLELKIPVQGTPAPDNSGNNADAEN